MKPHDIKSNTDRAYSFYFLKQKYKLVKDV